MIFKPNSAYPKILWLLLTLALTLAIGSSWYPGFTQPDKFLPDDNDSLLITYILNQSQQNFLSGDKSRFWGSFFAPFSDTLRYSDSFTTSALLTLPWSGQAPAVIFNTAALIALLFTSLTTFLLIKHLTKSSPLGLFGALMFNFSGFHWHYFSHLQVFGLWSLPLALYLYLRWQEQGKTKNFAVLLLVLTAQIAESFFLFYVTVFGLLVLMLNQRPHLKRPESLLMAGAGLIWLAFAFPYWQLTQEFDEAKRTIRDAAHFSLGLDELLPKYKGQILALLAVITFPNLKGRFRPFLAILGLGIIMALGPVLKFGQLTVKFFSLPLPLPYSIFYYLVPGFTGFRTPSRWIVLAALAAVVLICLGLNGIRSRLLKISLAAVFTILVIGQTSKPRSYPVDAPVPSVYEAVGQLPETAVILELPIKLWSQEGNQIESVRSLYSLSHQRRRVNGYSGFAPLVWIEVVRKINDKGLTTEVVNQLKVWGVTHIVQGNQLRPI